jgi:hypothetical protein
LKRVVAHAEASLELFRVDQDVEEISQQKRGDETAEQIINSHARPQSRSQKNTARARMAKLARARARKVMSTIAKPKQIKVLALAVKQVSVKEP